MWMEPALRPWLFSAGQPPPHRSWHDHSHGHHHHHLRARSQLPEFSPSSFHFITAALTGKYRYCTSTGRKPSFGVKGRPKVTKPPVGDVSRPHAPGTTSPHLPRTTRFARKAHQMSADVFLKIITIKFGALQGNKPWFSWKPRRKCPVACCDPRGADLLSPGEKPCKKPLKSTSVKTNSY